MGKAKGEAMSRSNPEHAAQVAVMKWAALACGSMPELRLLFAIPNGGARNVITGARLKAEGVRAGVPDLFLPVARHDCHGLFIEMKSSKGVTTRLQDAWLYALDAEGYRVEVCRSAQAAIDTITEYLKGGTNGQR